MQILETMAPTSVPISTTQISSKCFQKHAKFSTSDRILNSSKVFMKYSSPILPFQLQLKSNTLFRQLKNPKTAFTFCNHFDSYVTRITRKRRNQFGSTEATEQLYLINSNDRKLQKKQYRSSTRALYILHLNEIVSKLHFTELMQKVNLSGTRIRQETRINKEHL